MTTQTYIYIHTYTHIIYIHVHPPRSYEKFLGKDLSSSGTFEQGFECGPGKALWGSEEPSTGGDFFLGMEPTWIRKSWMVYNP